MAMLLVGAAMVVVAVVANRWGMRHPYGDE